MNDEHFKSGRKKNCEEMLVQSEISSCHLTSLITMYGTIPHSQQTVMRPHDIELCYNHGTNEEIKGQTR
jgi:hypothetical protein